VVGYDEKGNVVAIGESKAAPSITKDHIAKWSRIVEDLLKGEYGDKLDEAFFSSTGRYKDSAVKQIEN